MQTRRRLKKAVTFFERCTEEAERLRKEAESLPPGPEREELESKARKAETAAHIEDWLRSPELQPPK